MEITGKLIQILPIQTGEGKNGVWKKQDIILEFEQTPSKKLCIGFWNDKINTALMEDSMLKVSFEIDSREYNDKWYTNLRGLKVEEISEMGLKDITPEDANKDFPFDTSEKDKNFSFPQFESDEVLPF